MKGPVGAYTLITSVADLLTFYDKPTATNASDWYQAYNFLQYGNKLLLSRASNVNGLATDKSDPVPTAVLASANTAVVGVTNGATFAVGDIVAFEATQGLGVDLVNQYEVISIATNNLTLDRNVVQDIPLNSATFTVRRSMNAMVEAVANGAAQVPVQNYFSTMQVVENIDDYLVKEISLAMTSVDSKIKFTTRNPGAWGNNIEVCIANPAMFSATVPTEAFTGIPLDSLFDYPPTGNEVGIVIRDGINIVETWTVSFDPAAKDNNNKSLYIEDVINNKSSYVYAKDNTANTTAVQDYCAVINGTAVGTINLVNGTDSPIQADDLLNAYDIFSNKEMLDLDIVIANELDNGASAVKLVNARLDCICFIGANYGDCVGKKSAIATGNLIAWRKTGSINYNNMFVVACGNYVYQYDRYNDKYRWVNIAGHCAGLRAQTSSNRASWWASAGLERGQLKGISKISFSPTQGQRDLLYKNRFNCSVH